MACKGGQEKSGCLLLMFRGIARGPSYWDEPPSGQETGLIRLFMDSVQEGRR